MARTANMATRMAGFSAIELLVTTTIIGIMISAAASAMGRFMARQNIVLESEQLISTLNNARITAIAANDRVVLCPSSDRRSCSREPDWHYGLLVFVDRNRDREFDPEDRLLLARQSSGSRVSITTSRARRRISYNGVGTSPGSNVTFSLCDPSGLARPRAVIISNSGRARRSDTRPRGDPIRCPRS